MSTLKPAAFVLLAALVLSGCAASIHNLTKTQYLNEDFSADVLRAGGLALLPITAGEGHEAYRRPLGERFNQQLPAALPGTRILAWEASMDSLNNHNLVSDYQALIEAYKSTSIIDRQGLMRLAPALPVRYALYCSLQDYSESSNTKFSVFSGPTTTTTANVMAQCLVLDLHTGDVMQEIAGHAKSEAGELEVNSPYEKFADSVVRGVLSQLPGSTVQSGFDEFGRRVSEPGEEPKRWDQ